MTPPRLCHGRDPRLVDRIVLSITTVRARSVAAAAFLVGAGLLAALISAHSSGGGAPAVWLVTLTAVVVVARGFHLGRPVTCGHAMTALVLLLGGAGGYLYGRHWLGGAMAVAAASALAWPTPSRPDPSAVPVVWELVRRTHGDPLAPFAMNHQKSYFFNDGASAAVAYRTRLGLAVVSGDPIGQPDEFADLVAGFAAMCRSRGWCVVVLGCSRDRLALWRQAIHPPLRAVPIGSDVEIDVQQFALSGRRFRNLRQAVARTHNRGVRTEVIDEQDLDPVLTAELAAVLHASHHAARWERGFSMILDSALEGRYPGVVLLIGRDRAGVVQGFHRYLVAGDGSDVTLDVPWRRPDAPNGLDERLTADMIEWCKNHDTRRLSMAFAPFPDLFENSERRAVDAFYYRVISLGSPLIRLESLYRYLRKFHALGNQRYVLSARRHIPLALLVLLTLEFLPRRRGLDKAR